MKKKPAAPREKKTEVLSLRLPPDIKQRLVEAKARSGRSINDEICERLTNSFDPSAAIVRIRYLLEAKAGKGWQESPWVTQQLAAAAAQVIIDAGAKGEIVPPKIQNTAPGIDPENYGRSLAQFLHMFGELA